MGSTLKMCVAMMVMAPVAAAFAQTGSGISIPRNGGGGGAGDVKDVPAVVMPAAPEKTVSEKLGEQDRRRKAASKELYKLRAKYFGSMGRTEIRQVGITKLREYTDAALFPLLIDIFGEEQTDVQRALLDHFADQKSDEGDSSIAWVAVFGKKAEFRSAAADRLAARMREVGTVSNMVKMPMAIGLRSRDLPTAAAAANLTVTLELYEAIPMLIASQILSSDADSGDPNLSLAYIFVGRQQSFVSDLTPVVGDAAVGFDPTLSVISTGVVLRVINAAVYTYNFEIHNALVALSTRGWGGQSTARLGWDNAKWMKWEKDEFEPYRAKVAAEKAAEEKAEKEKSEAEKAGE